MKKILVITPLEHSQDSFDKLHSIPNHEVSYKPYVTPEEFINLNDDVVAIFTNPNKSKIFLGPKSLYNFSGLEVICTASTGTNHIDRKYLQKNNIQLLSLTNERQVINNISSTAEHALALTLAKIRNIPQAFDSVHQTRTWDYEPYMGRQMKDLTVGVVGYGRLGTFYSSYCDAIGSKVLVYDPYKDIPHSRIKQVDQLSELFAKADIISLHAHVSDETRNMICSEVLQYAQPHVLIVNTSRGDLVMESDLVSFLKNNPDASYATDVLANEINGISDNPILEYALTNTHQILITPHIAGMTLEAQNTAYGHAATMLYNRLS